MHFPVIRQKIKLTIGDAMTSVYEGGPGFRPEHLWQPNALIVGEDRVAIDQIAWGILEKKRAEMGLKTLEAAGRPPRYIATAADSDAWTRHQRSAAHQAHRDLTEESMRGEDEQLAIEHTSPGPLPAQRHRLTRREACCSSCALAASRPRAAGAGFWLSERSKRPVPATAEQARKDHRIAPEQQWPHLTVTQYATGRMRRKPGEPRALVQKALENLGGISRFIARRMSSSSSPTSHGTARPSRPPTPIPTSLPKSCASAGRAGAKRVIVTDVSCNEARRCFHRSGIEAAAQTAGAEVILPDPENFREVDMGGVVLKSWPVFMPFLEADKILNLPIAKHHGLTGATLGMKNWYGILGGQRNRLHQQIHQSLADLAAFMLPTLTIMDCYRILLRNGPTGGNLEDVALKKTVVAGTDPVALDAYVAKAYWNLDAEHLPYLRMAANRGLGTVEFEKLAIKTSQLS